LPESAFETITQEFASQWRQGKREITLSPIVCEGLRDVSKEEEDEDTDKEEKVIQDAVDIFGDLVTIKK